MTRSRITWSPSRSLFSLLGLAALAMLRFRQFATDSG
jgi:MYXO-CTERM domain-containing protein